MDTIFSGAANDGVVSVVSQTANSPNGRNSVAFSQLAHALGGPGRLVSMLSLGALSNANVLKQPQVANMVSCLLLSAGLGSCKDPGGATPAQTYTVSARDFSSSASGTVGAETPITSQNASPQTNVFRVDDALAKVTQPSEDLSFAEANELTIEVHDPALTTLDASQIVELNGDENAPSSLDGGDVKCPILHRPDGSSFILVTPLRLGKVVFHFVGHTADGTIWYQKLRINVKQSTRTPDELMLTPGGTSGETAGILALPIGGPNPSFVFPQARYNGLSAIIDLDHSAVTFVVRGIDVLSLNKETGELTPIRAGEALIKTTFQGASNFTCVVVTDSPVASPNMACEKLLHPGEALSLPDRLRTN